MADTDADRPGDSVLEPPVVRHTKMAQIATDIAQIGRLRGGRAMFYWAAVLVLAWGLSVGSCSTGLGLFAPMTRVVTPDVAALCPSPTACSVEPRDGQQSKFGWKLNDQKGTAAIAFTVLSENEGPTLLQVGFVWDTDDGLRAVARRLPTVRDAERGEMSSVWWLVRVHGTEFPNMTSPTIEAPVSGQFLEAAFDEYLTSAARLAKSAISPDFRNEAKAEFRRGLRELKLYGNDAGFNPFYIRRVSSGPIQSFTYIAFWAFLIIAVCRYLVNVRGLESGRAEFARELNDDSRLQNGNWSERVRALARFAFTDVSHLTYLSKDLARVAFNWLRAGTARAELPSLLADEQVSLEKMWDAEYQPLRYLIWSIPTIGFIGTIVGVSQAMLATSRLSSPDQLTRLLGRGDVSASIGVAFDTTLVALLLGLIANLIFYDLQAREFSGLQHLRDQIVDFLGGHAGSPSDKDIENVVFVENARNATATRAELERKDTELKIVSDRLTQLRERRNRAAEIGTKVAQLREEAEAIGKTLEGSDREVAALEERERHLLKEFGDSLKPS